MTKREKPAVPVPSTPTDGGQPIPKNFENSIPEEISEDNPSGKNTDEIRRMMRLMNGIKVLSGALASIGVVTPHLQIQRIWQGLRPLYPVAASGDFYA